MEYRKFGDQYAVRIDRGEEVTASLMKFAAETGVRLGAVSGLGAADHAVVGLYDVEKQVYMKNTFDFPMEISSIIGSITTQDGAPYLHIHVTLCDAAGRAYGGHLTELRISGTCELFITAIDGTVEREKDRITGTGLNLFKFV